MHATDSTSICILFPSDLGPQVTCSNNIVGFPDRVVNHLSERNSRKLVQSHHQCFASHAQFEQVKVARVCSPGKDLLELPMTQAGIKALANLWLHQRDL